MPDKHLSTQFDSEINDVCSRVMEMGGLVEAQIRQSVYSLTQLSAEVTDQVLDRPYITICTGGIDANRTYNHWLKVLQIIDTSRELNLINHVVLLGSDNGLITAQKIQTTEFKQLKITSLVNQLSILNNRAVIAGSELYIGADGGLMHVAHTTQTPTISLFSAQERPYLRLTPACHSTGVQSSGDVSLIKADHLTDLIKEHFYKINA